VRHIGLALESYGPTRYSNRNGKMHSTSTWTSFGSRSGGLSCLWWSVSRVWQLRRRLRIVPDLRPDILKAGDKGQRSERWRIEQ